MDCKLVRLGACAAMALLLGAADPVPQAATETVVLVRHGEKPPAGLGQLTCRGLNRGLALPGVFMHMFGRPAAIFAPDPAAKKRDGAGLYDYVRPLATVEPSAVAFGMPVQADLGVDDTAGLVHLLLDPAYRASTLLVGWEHHAITGIARALLQAGGGTGMDGAVPEWSGDDYDTMFVVRIVRPAAGPAHASFERAAEGLDGMLETCPGDLIR